MGLFFGTNMKLSSNFHRSEFECKCGCGFATVDVKLIEALEAIREHFKQPVTITSGCRCRGYNRKIGGAPGSKHQFGIAADIVVKDVDPAFVYEFAEQYFGYEYGGVGKYSKFTHIDVRADPARWGNI